jgi:two-component system alkaline phosphatase synthesis response regulator PhoP
VNVLVAEDDADIADLVAHYFRREGWTVHVVSSGKDALARARSSPPNLAVLDVMLPGMTGFDICRELRASPETASMLIIMLTARADEADRIHGLDIGADDYVLKPFSPNELVARVKALLRRTKRQDDVSQVLRLGPLIVDSVTHTVTLDGTSVDLAAKEYLLLKYLLERRGRVVSRDLLLTDVWGYTYTGGTRTVDVHVRRLREKLPLLTKALVTVKQFGYKIVDPE